MGAGTGLGLGMGAGFPIGQEIAQAIQPAVQKMNKVLNPQQEADPVAKLAYLKKLLDEGILTQDEYITKRAAIIEKL